MLPNPLKVYLDTSILNFAISTQDVPHEQTTTLKFLEQIEKGIFLPYVSSVVLEEIERTPEKVRRQGLIELIEQYELESLPLVEEVKVLAEKYIQEKIIPIKKLNDALHIAVASVYGLDIIVSWNFEHMVKLKTRREVQGVNALMGYKPIEICSPLEII